MTNIPSGNLIIYAASSYNLKILNKLPKHIIPFGLGENNFSYNWLCEKNLKYNISNLNIYYGEASGVYALWKNELEKFTKDQWIGICHYRKLWLDKLYEKKQKYSFDTLYSRLLSPQNIIFDNSESILIQPIIYKNKNLIQDFEQVHGKDILENCLRLYEYSDKNLFRNHLANNILYGLNMWITKPDILNNYCSHLFPWLYKCLNFFFKNKLCEGYNIRLPSFLAERFCSYWFSTKTKFKCLSYARLGKMILSNQINNFINPLKVPFTFRMYPTIHDY
jgi:hypothetical protein